MSAWVCHVMPTRPLPLSLAILAHVIVAGLLMTERSPRPERAAPTQLVYVLPVYPVQSPATLPPRKIPPRIASPAIAPSGTATPSPQPEPESVTSIPRIDWQREIELSARGFAEREEQATRYRSLNAKPQVLAIPEKDDEPASGTVTLLPNGDKQAEFWMGDTRVTCVSPQVALDEAFAVWAKNRPPRCSLKGRRKRDVVPEPKPRAYRAPPLPHGPPEMGPPEATDVLPAQPSLPPVPPPDSADPMPVVPQR